MRGTNPMNLFASRSCGGVEKITTHWMTQKFNLADSVADVKTQTDNKHSLFESLRNLIAYRNSNKPLTYGSIEAIADLPSSIIGFERTFDTKTEVVFHNISGKYS